MVLGFKMARCPSHHPPTQTSPKHIPQAHRRTGAMKVTAKDQGDSGWLDTTRCHQPASQARRLHHPLPLPLPHTTYSYPTRPLAYHTLMHPLFPHHTFIHPPPAQIQDIPHTRVGQTHTADMKAMGTHKDQTNRAHIRQARREDRTGGQAPRASKRSGRTWGARMGVSGSTSCSHRAPMPCCRRRVGCAVCSGPGPPARASATRPALGRPAAGAGGGACTHNKRGGVQGGARGCMGMHGDAAKRAKDGPDTHKHE
jgi:hypothetical protein